MGMDGMGDGEEECVYVWIWLGCVVGWFGWVGDICMYGRFLGMVCL